MMEICFFSSALGANLDGGESHKESMLYRHEAKHEMRPAHQMGREIKSSNFVVRGPLNGFAFNLKMANMSNISILPKDQFQYHVLYGM